MILRGREGFAQCSALRTELMVERFTSNQSQSQTRHAAVPELDVQEFSLMVAVRAAQESTDLTLKVLHDSVGGVRRFVGDTVCSNARLHAPVRGPRLVIADNILASQRGALSDKPPLFRASGSSLVVPSPMCAAQHRTEFCRHRM